MKYVDDFREKLSKKTLAFLVAGMLFGLTIGFFASQTQQVSADQASQKLLTTLESQSGQQLEVVNTRTENGLYRIDVSNSQNELSTYHVTKDGRLVSAGMNDLDQLRQTIAAQQQFVGCLSERGVALYGNSSQQATATQIQLLGGANTVSPIFQDVNTEGVLQEASQRGVQRVPSFYYNESVLSGVNQLSQISQFTGCQFGASQ